MIGAGSMVIWLPIFAYLAYREYRRMRKPAIPLIHFIGGTNAIVRAKNQHRKNTTGISTIKYKVE